MSKQLFFPQAKSIGTFLIPLLVVSWDNAFSGRNWVRLLSIPQEKKEKKKSLWLRVFIPRTKYLAVVLKLGQAGSARYLCLSSPGLPHKAALSVGYYPYDAITSNSTPRVFS